MSIDGLLILTDEQLVKMAQEGSETAEEILINKYKSFVRGKAKAYYIAGADQDDVVQEGMIGLFKAIRSFDPDKTAGFRTFADTCVNSQILTAIKKANRQKHMPLNESVSLNSAISPDEADGRTNITLGDIVQASLDEEPESALLMRELTETLSSSGNSIFSELELRVWNEKLQGSTYKEIAEKLGKSPKTIDNAIQRIKKKVVAYLEK